MSSKCIHLEKRKLFIWLTPTRRLTPDELLLYFFIQAVSSESMTHVSENINEVHESIWGRSRNVNAQTSRCFIFHI